MDCRVLCFLLRKRRGAKKDSKLAKNSCHKHVAKSCHKIRPSYIIYVPYSWRFGLGGSVLNMLFHHL